MQSYVGQQLPRQDEPAQSFDLGSLSQRMGTTVITNVSQVPANPHIQHGYLLAKRRMVYTMPVNQPPVPVKIQKVKAVRPDQEMLSDIYKQICI